MAVGRCLRKVQVLLQKMSCKLNNSGNGLGDVGYQGKTANFYNHISCLGSRSVDHQVAAMTARMSEMCSL